MADTYDTAAVRLSTHIVATIIRELAVLIPSIRGHRNIVPYDSGYAQL